MATNGFITLHRKITENPVWQNDGLLKLFLYLLLTANHEQTRFLWNGQEQVLERGQLLTGRFELAKAVGASPNTTKSRIATLTLMGIITIKSTNKFSIITVIKYDDYQLQKNSSPTKPPTGHQQDTNKTPHTTRYNKDNNVTTLTNVSGELPKTDNRNPVIQELWEFGKTLGFGETKQNLQRYAISRLVKKVPPDKLKKAAEFAREVKDRPYAPQVNNWMDLEDKLQKLRDFVQRTNTKQEENQKKTLIL